MLIDTHCHLDPEHCGAGPEELLARARGEGVGGVVCIGVGGLDQARFAVELASRREDVAATVGVHPHDAASHDQALADGLRALLEGGGRSGGARTGGAVSGGAMSGGAETDRVRSDDVVVAIGEVGLDYHYDHSPRPTQREIFAVYVALARELRLPLVIHTRNAAAETLELLRSEKASDVGGVIHCFSEDLDFARQALDLGFHLSFSGIVTFKKATAIQEVAAWAPLDRVLVETDSPYLAPVPHRGKTNEPAYVVHTARFIAALRGTPFEELCAATTENARALFRLPPAFGEA